MSSMRSILTALLLLAALSSCMSASRKERAMAYAALGTNLLQQGQYDDAVQQLKKAVELDPDSGDSHHSLAMVYFAKKSYDLAESHFRKAESLNPDDPNLFNNFGAFYLELNKCDKALQYLKKATDHPNYRTPFRAQNNLGLAYFCLRDFARAKENFTKALKLSPRFAIAYNNLGKVHFEEGQYKLAEKAFRQAVKIEPSYLEAYYYLGTTQVALKQRRAALETFRSCAEKNPEDLFAAKCQERLDVLK